MLQSSLVAIGGGSVANKSGGVEAPDPGISGGDGASGGAAGGGGGKGGVAGGGGKVAATERTKIVLACLFEALGAKRATREVARVLCTLSAGAAETMAAAAAAAAAAPATGMPGVPPPPPRRAAAVAPAAAAVAPPALLPVLASLPERCKDVVGLALEVLETGQAAADVLASQGGAAAAAGADSRAVVFGSADSAGRWGVGFGDGWTCVYCSRSEFVFCAMRCLCHSVVAGPQPVWEGRKTILFHAMYPLRLSPSSRFFFSFPRCT